MMLEHIENDKWRLGFHLMPPTGWLNDPNGLCQFKGEYHVFYQYSPGEPEGGRKYWGHYISRDFLKWKDAGVALSPSETFDSHGVYSGSALVSKGKMNLFYTGNVKLKGDYNYITDGRQGNTVHVSSEDGLHFSEKRCLMTNADYPKDLTCHVRDPKVVGGDSIGLSKEDYYMLLGARTSQDIGEVLVYKSKDLDEWKLCNILVSEEPFGYMWECPDAFVLDGRTFLSISPQGIEAEGINYQNIYQSGYYSLEGNVEAKYQLKTFQEWDRGFDFYAPQSFVDESGRRILIGWIGMPDDPKQSNPTVSYGWQNALTVPRELSLKDNRILQYPVEEMLNLRKEKHSMVCNETSPEMPVYDVEIVVEQESDFLAFISEGICLKYEKNKNLFSVSFDTEKNLGYGRDTRAVYLETCNEIRILADTSCLEIYLNRGEEVFTTRFYTETGKSDFRVEKGALEINRWILNPMTVTKER